MTFTDRCLRTAGMLLAIGAIGAIAACSGSTPPAEASEEHHLPDLPGLSPVLLPPGFSTYETHQYEFSSKHPVHVDSGFFGFEVSNDTGTNERCRGQITVSPYSADVAAPAAYVGELGTKLCDADWSVTDEAAWQQTPGDTDVWMAEATAQDVGWFGTSEAPAVGVVVVDEDRGVIIGLWAEVEVYSPDEAVEVARQIAQSVG